MSCAQGTSSQQMVQRSSLMVWKMVCGVTPRSRTLREPTSRPPSRWILAPVWYSGGMHKKTSSCVVWWCSFSMRAACTMEVWSCKMALGKPVVPLEK